MWSVVVAVALGVGVGHANLALRARTSDSTLNTLLSFTAPFLASVPSEHLGASGLVAAVTAGLVTGQGSVRYLRAQDRVYERTTWSTIGMVLEGGLFLLMGLQLAGLVQDVQTAHGSALVALGFGTAGLLLALVIRSGYVAVLLARMDRRTPSSDELRAWLEVAERERLRRRGDDGELPGSDRRTEGWTRRADRLTADVAYFERWPLGRREGVVLVWAGMRGAITVAAALTIPASADAAGAAGRSLLVLIAYSAAAVSLLVQGGTLAWVVRALDLQVSSTEVDSDERIALVGRMAQAALDLVDDPDLRRPDGSAYDTAVLDRVRTANTRRTNDQVDDRASARGAQLLELRLRVIAAQREVLLEARETGTVSSGALGAALELLDADQVRAELMTGESGES